MANKFRVNQLLLTNNTVTTTGNNIYVNGLGNYTTDNPLGFATSGNLTNASGALSSQTQASGSFLFGLINASSAGVSSLNGQSGAINFTGAGNASVIVNGQNFTISGNTGHLVGYATINNLLLTGQQAWTSANNNATNLSGNLQTTGSTLDNKINSLSGMASTWSTLSWVSTINWNVTTGIFEDRKRIVLTGDAILAINGLYNGWAGALEVVQSGNSTTGYSLTLPAATKVLNSGAGILNLTRISGTRDIAGFEYNGANLFCALGNSFT